MKFRLIFLSIQLSLNLLVVGVTGSPAIGQSMPTAAEKRLLPDSAELLTPENFLQIVREHHPIARQAGLQEARGEAEVQMARGAFDPYAFADLAQKYYSGSEYYSLLDGGLKMPTWFGLELKAGYEENDGVFLNPENRTPGAGLLYAGISLPVGQGLFIDRRRTDLRQAQVYQLATEAVRQAMVNRLIYDAGTAYWDWFRTYHATQVYASAVELALERRQAVQQGALLGDRPAVDTLEAGIQVQNRQLSLMQAKLELANAAALLSIYLWAEGTIPLELAPNAAPLSLDELQLESGGSGLILEWENLLAVHPELLQTQYKLEQLDIERRWKQEQLKPVLNLNYNALTAATGDDALSGYSSNNYKWGLEFALPIFQRKARGGLNVAKLKMQETELDIAYKRATLDWKIQTSVNDLSTSRQQVILYRQNATDYSNLLSAEQQLFASGESSLFLVNSRESSAINAQVKLIDMLFKNRKAELALEYALGVLD